QSRRYSSFCFFFFQAEDGIRDLIVTGVQTCALPISRLRRVLVRLLEGEGFTCAEAGSGVEALEMMQQDPVPLVISDLRMPQMDRSEERRVGKECRGGGAGEEEKKRGREVGNRIRE